MWLCVLYITITMFFKSVKVLSSGPGTDEDQSIFSRIVQLWNKYRSSYQRTKKLFFLLNKWKPNCFHIIVADLKGDFISKCSTMCNLRLLDFYKLSKISFVIVFFSPHYVSQWVWRLFSTAFVSMTPRMKHAWVNL